MYASLLIVLLTLISADGHLALNDYTDIYNDDHALRVLLHNERGFRSLGMSSAFSRGCLHEGRWYGAGAHVKTRDTTCLQCACGRGALSCRHRACASPPRPPPKGCHLLHRKDACCPELHCADGVTVLELDSTSRLDDGASFDEINVAALSHACVESGTVYASGSAMSSSMACEQCFCLRGSRRCVRPQCLPAPAGCHPKPAAGACCPQRYYCEHHLASTAAPEIERHRDCKVSGTWYSEGERVHASESNCSHCFCLRGTVHCHPLLCAPPLHGCTPILRSGECCPHQYLCHHDGQGSNEHNSNDLTYNNHNYINLEPLKSARLDNTDAPSTDIEKHDKIINKDGTETTTDRAASVATNKVKRKTNDSETKTISKEEVGQQHISEKELSKKQDKQNTKEKLIELERMTMEQPEGSMKIVINGTINCTTELTSSNETHNTDKQTDIMERTPNIDRMDIEIEDHTYNPNDIITDRSTNGEYDENETFTINVTSSLNANKTAPGPVMYEGKKGIVSDVTDVLNASKNAKEDYDYDYNEPTLPPSLPNLKIIPFVAADAVVDEDRTQEPALPNYPILEREDKFPVYYPHKQESLADRREDKYPNLPLFTSEKTDSYPSLTHDTSNDEYDNLDDLATPVHEYTAPLSFGNPFNDAKEVTEDPNKTTVGIEAPAVNLFSPPVETEGGFIPKGPGIIDEYYAGYPSTPSNPSIPHLTTSMQLDTDKGTTCLSADGRQVLEGDTVSLSCSICTCAWGELHCSPRPCLTPPGCSRRPATISTADLCCGELECRMSNNTRLRPSTTTSKTTTTTTEFSLDSEEEYEDEEEPEEFHGEEIGEKIKPDERTSINTTPKSNQMKNKTVEVSSSNKKTEDEVANNNMTQAIPNSETKVNENNYTTTHSDVKVIENKENIVKHLLASEIRDDLMKNISQVAQVSVEKHVILTTENTVNKETSQVLKELMRPVETTTVKQDNVTEDQNQEYEDEEEEEDEGFSFGSVLKLLLSDSYDSKTEKPKPPKRFTTTTEKIEPTRTTSFQYDIPMKLTTPKYETPIKLTTPKNEDPIKLTSPRYEIPIKLTPTRYETPIKLTTGRYETPFKLTTGRYETPFKLPTGGYETPIKLTTGRYETPIKLTTGRYETTVRSTTTKYETPAKENNYKYTTKTIPKVEETTTMRATSTTTTPKTTTTKKISINPSLVPFVPIPNNQQVYAPPKNTFPTKTVNKIDHLVLGEATAIKKTTNKPVSYKPINYKLINRITTKKPYTVTTSTKAPLKTEVIGSGYTSVAHEGSRLPGSNLLGGGLLKLAGCNIYGRMYRVGRIIDELSTPCSECRCTELGVQCRALKC